MMSEYDPLRYLRDKGNIGVLWLNSPGADTPVWKHLWNNSLIRVCTDGAANILNPLVCNGTINLPHLIAGDFDSINDASRLFFQKKGVKFVETPDQDFTDMCKALRIIVDEVQRSSIKLDCIWILGGFSGRFDHTMSSLHSMLRFQSYCTVPIYAIDGTNLIFVLKRSKNKIVLYDHSMITKICGFIPFCQERTTVTTQGFKWDLSHSDVAFGGIISTSNQVIGNQVEIETTAPLIFTLQLTETAVRLQ
ncbi:hypothetical protein AB6A40_008447 [Gnathostoma spinigerum]|uniref:Thiamine pyrophosphokinase n=1 Tax=Gnathostoma spinigerum TaxID=75299 RepID=A0ABD6EPE5_9BILA